MSYLSADVVIVGAGIVGLSSAYYIKKNHPEKDVLVVDGAHTFGQGNTGKSAAGFRDLFTSDINFKLSNSSIKFYSDTQNKGIDIGMKFVGYMFLLNQDNSNIKYLKDLSEKTPVRELHLKDLEKYEFLRTKLPSEVKSLLNLDDIDIALVGENCGIIEPELVAEHYYNLAVNEGVKFKFDSKVKPLRLDARDKLDFPGEPFIWQEFTLKSIETEADQIRFDNLILASDVWTTELLEPTGIDSHVRPKKRQIFQLSGSPVEKILSSWKENLENVFPFTILPAHGVYIRPAPKYHSLWIGCADDYNRSFSLEDDPQAEDDFYTYNIAQILGSYFPSLGDAKITGKWAGYYSYNTIDMTPYIFRELNIIVATGTSGSGIMKADSIGRVVEALFSNKDETELYNGAVIKTSSLGIRNRSVQHENLVL
ncbi:MAG: FAD-binding oxidoreductase [Thermoplasmatales archaeon]|nr:FAD-binding oxidoreductase [Thermoplasmatales archaeon]MCW6169828.1 FAD-binding oxidoreductase [Thermoplasmatales archaeon]